MGSEEIKQIEPEKDNKFIIRHEKRINNIIMLKDGANVATCSDDNIIKITNFDNSYNFYPLKGKQDILDLVEISSNLLISCNLDGSLTLWGKQEGFYCFLKQIDKENCPGFNLHQLGINKIIALNDEGNFITCSEDGTINSWSIINLSKRNEGEKNIQITGKYELKVSGIMEDIISIFLFNNVRFGKKFIVIGLNTSKKIEIFDAETFSPLNGQKILPYLVQYPNALSQINFENEDYLLVGCSNSVIILKYNGNEFEQVKKCEGNFLSVTCFSQIKDEDSKLNGLFFGTSHGDIYYMSLYNLFHGEKMHLAVAENLFCCFGITNMITKYERRENRIVILASSEAGVAIKFRVNPQLLIDPNEIVEKREENVRLLNPFTWFNSCKNNRNNHKIGNKTKLIDPRTFQKDENDEDGGYNKVKERYELNLQY